MWAWIKSWFVRKPRLPIYTELEDEDDDREMQKDFFLQLPTARRDHELMSKCEVKFEDPQQQFRITGMEDPDVPVH